MAEITEAQEKAVQGYEETLDRWMGEPTKEDVEKVIKALKEWKE